MSSLTPDILVTAIYFTLTLLVVEALRCATHFLFNRTPLLEQCLQESLAAFELCAICHEITIRKLSRKICLRLEINWWVFLMIRFFSARKSTRCLVLWRFLIPCIRLVEFDLGKRNRCSIHILRELDFGRNVSSGSRNGHRLPSRRWDDGLSVLHEATLVTWIWKHAFGKDLFR